MCSMKAWIAILIIFVISAGSVVQEDPPGDIWGGGLPDELEDYFNGLSQPDCSKEVVETPWCLILGQTQGQVASGVSEIEKTSNENDIEPAISYGPSEQQLNAFLERVKNAIKKYPAPHNGYYEWGTE